MAQLVMADGCFMKKKNKMMHKINKHHHGHGHGHGHGFFKRHHGRVNVCGGPAGHHSEGLVDGVGEVFIIFRGRHHHHHHSQSQSHIGLVPEAEDRGHLNHHHGKKHHGKGHGLFGRRCHHGRCVKLGLITFKHEGGEGSGAAGFEERNDAEASPGTPTVPQTEAMMENLTLTTTDNEEPNHP